MRCALLTLALLTACGAKKHPSLALQGAISDDAGPSGSRSCPWTAPSTVRLEHQTVWLDDLPWSVASEGGVQRLTEALVLCGKTDALGPFRDWRRAEQAAVEARKTGSRDTAATLGATLIAGAVTSAASSAGAGASSDGSQLAHAVRDQNLQAAPSPVTTAIDPQLERARQAFIDALLQ